ncbi:uncharacterized protein EV420DRAFT_1487526 [Desarmillaria tabescens]|uniref:Uncharacterized protein n=1 Tax=Armillaria tabescens TaxID=1929756 RepID=A0AA39MJU1_ARMTA|nr:uncharacterized protein EV420DRAFT_1487526 [Desarmillaria tabescens]KAK0436339.1 hypothetical protein EV420DRAFT_1487526 [Desarmillaria tabescens]
MANLRNPSKPRPSSRWFQNPITTADKNLLVHTILGSESNLRDYENHLMELFVSELSITTKNSRRHLNLVHQAHAERRRARAEDRQTKARPSDIPKLHHIQRKLYLMAFGINEFIPLCTHFGAGKCRKDPILNELNETTGTFEFEIIYVTPMKALVQEMSANSRTTLGVKQQIVEHNRTISIPTFVVQAFSTIPAALQPVSRTKAEILFSFEARFPGMRSSSELGEQAIPSNTQSLRQEDPRLAGKYHILVFVHPQKETIKTGDIPEGDGGGDGDDYSVRQS